MQDKVIRISIITILISVYSLQYLAGLQSDDAFLCQWMHVNIFHLSANCWALWSILRSRMMPSSYLLVVGVLFGWLGFACTSNVMGFSGALYAMLGIQWRYFNSRINLIITASIFALGIILPQLTAVAHIIPFTLGLMFGYVYNFFKDYYYETKR